MCPLRHNSTRGMPLSFSAMAKRFPRGVSPFRPEDIPVTSEFLGYRNGTIEPMGLELIFTKTSS